MDLNEYQHLASRTVKPGRSTEESLTNWAFGLIGETGEVVDILKKCIFHGHSLEENREKLANEIGDVLWYVSQLAVSLDLSLDEIGEKNIEKLKKRYPEGFEDKKSIHRQE